jgi:phenylacetate-CoA ligase
MQSIKSAIFFTKYSIIKPNALRAFRQALSNQYLSRDELDNLNWSMTRRLLEYAYVKTDFYKKRFDALGLHPEDVKCPDDFSKVPVLTRKDLKENFNVMISKDARGKDLRISTTGGSTGEPVKVYHQKNVVRAAMGWRMLSWWGLEPGDDFASVYRDIRTDWKAYVVNSLTWWPTRKIFLNAVQMDNTQIASFLRHYGRVKPKLVHGYVGAVDNLASYILDKKIAVPSPVAIWVTSAPLSKVQEHRISKAFGAPVYDQYGSCEVYWMAAECPAKNGLHMFQDTKRIEFLDNNNLPCLPGEIGNIAVTDLENFYFPLIRYLNGDRGRALPGECSCGVKLPLMDKVRGRITDIIRLPNGSSIAGDYMTTLFDDFPDAVKQFQVHQHADYSLEIRVIPEVGIQNIDDTLTIVRKRLVTSIAGQTTVTIIKTNTIQQTGGKLRFVKSDLK